MKRRDFLSTFAGASALLWPIVGAAQQPKVATIGVLIAKSSGSEQFWQGFQQEMRKLAYVEGKSVRYEFRSDEGKVSRLPELAAELVQLKPDVIVTWFTPAAFAAKRATRDIPIVMGAAGNPVETGLVESLARPGGNVTGVAGVGADLAGKLVELIRQMLPSAHRVVALANAPDPFSKPFVERIRLGGKATGTTIDPMMLRGPDELETAFAAMEKDPPDAVIVQPTLGAKGPAHLALKHRMPAVSFVREFAEQGGLMTYSAAPAENYRRAAAFVDKVLKGAKPDDLPVERPTRFELVINLKTAKALGLTVPPSLLARADEVIE
ncbi:MAG TPA: ABC transporter substrate-binding protein [Stellaceae bacterium]|jgi:putative ABC transport system substrate-binding protein|nr:ABC transporter substrate-binding protein [Stellaceae bacterium]